MLKWLKGNFWAVTGVIVGIVLLIFIKDIERLKEIESFFRRKKVEDEVNQLKSTLSSSKVHIDSNDEKLVLLAEDLKNRKIKVSNLSEDEVKIFYDDFFSS